MSPSRTRRWVAACALSLASTAFAVDGPPGWLAGCWEGEPGTAAEEAFEAWSAPRAGRMLGLTQTLRGTGSLFEYMRIDTGEHGLRYVPQPGGRAPVVFDAERVEPRRIVFSNMQHGFPKYIDYRRSGDRLEVRLSAAAPEQEGKHALYGYRRVACEHVFAAR